MLYLTLEKALNHVLQLDPDTLNRLGKLQGKVVKMSFTDWQMDCYILIQERGVHLVGDYQGSVDTTIRGTLIGLLKVSRSGASGPALFDQGVEVVGDPELGEQIRDILRQVDLDFEEYLSRFVGDTAAHEISWRTERAIELGKQTWRGIRDNIREFCQVEAQYLPTRGQVEDFYTQVTRLRDDVDRAAARLARIEAKVRGENKE